MIAKSKTHEQEQLIQSPPPDSIFQLFLHTPENLEQRHAAIARGFGMAQKVTRRTIDDFTLLEEDLETVNVKVKEILSDFKILTGAVKSMLNHLNSQHEIIEAGVEAVNSKETLPAQEIAKTIPDIEDNDHAMEI